MAGYYACGAFIVVELLKIVIRTIIPASDFSSVLNYSYLKLGLMASRFILTGGEEHTG